MNEKFKFIEINYHYHPEISRPEEVIRKHEPSNLFAAELKQQAEIILVKHINYRGELQTGGIRYYFNRGRNSFIHIPFTTHRFVKEQRPDLVLVQGFIFPLQVMALRKTIGPGPVLLLQHHAEVPFRRKKWFQQKAGTMVDGFLFTASGNAEEWIRAGIIPGPATCFEVPGASTLFTRLDKSACRAQLGLQEKLHILWVGRLNANKDPLTVINAFEKFTRVNPAARLHMLFGETDMLEAVKQRIRQSDGLADYINLVGRVPHHELPNWYSAADYFILASHREGGSYALMEAMACGCVPLVSRIPASMKMINNGKAGKFFEPGNTDQLLALLCSLKPEEQPALSFAAESFFRDQLSPSAVAGKLAGIYEQLKLKKAH